MPHRFHFPVGLLPVLCALALPILLTVGCSHKSPDIAGRWDATIVAGGAPVPFRLDLESSGHDATGYFFDGDRKIPSTSGRLEGDRIHLHFDIYNADLDATVDGGTLRGNYVVHRSHKEIGRPVTATRFHAESAANSAAPNIAGDWELRSTKGDASIAWKMVIQQDGPALRGAILRLDGDTGSLTGAFHDGSFTLSHFSGARPTLLEGSLASDGTLQLMLDRKDPIAGVRSNDAKAKSLKAEPDPFHTTSVKDPQDPLRFSGVDADGKTVTASDPRFHNKALIVSIGGTWCPNCMDEAPFLVDLYKKYHAQGLEIVGLNFESGDSAYDVPRVRSFEKRYAIPYPIVIAGSTDQAKDKLAQLVNFSAFPTTIFVGRDGRVKGIHDGFASVATGVEHEKLKEETEKIVQNLLAS
jgi:thiol-disulfide isomerase/thioredoxin